MTSRLWFLATTLVAGCARGGDESEGDGGHLDGFARSSDNTLLHRGYPASISHTYYDGSW
jgi:hypothetical protein